MGANKIEELLKDEEHAFWISDKERVALIEILGFVAGALTTGKLWFNKPCADLNQEYAALCITMAKRFANMPVFKEN